MNTIYLRLPQYVAAFYRGRDEEHPLREQDAVVFCEFSHEHAVLRGGLRLLPVEMQIKAHCYSQRAWHNICNGRRPEGGSRIFVRDAKVWPTSDEVFSLEPTRAVRSNEVRAWKEYTDYLCIGIPTEIVVGGRVRRTNASYSLGAQDAHTLARMLCNEFYSSVLDWLIQDRRFCNQNGVRRSRVESIERFLMCYNIPVSQSNRERETLRRQINRWLRKAYQLQNDRREFSDAYFKHITDEEAGAKEAPLTDKEKE